MKLLKNKNAISIIDALDQSGFETRFVGGCVRDELAGQEIGDIDLATTATPEQVKQALSSNFKVIPTGIQHGTVTVVTQDNQSYEVTTLRLDISTDGRHAEVIYTDDWQTDAARRDFTINALYVDRQGQIYDFHQGQEDLKSGVVRFIGEPEARIKEDYLRILRFFRFHSRFGRGEPEPYSLKACIQAREHLQNLSRERIRDEFFKLLLQMKDFTALKLITDNGIDRALFGQKFITKMWRSDIIENRDLFYNFCFVFIYKSINISAKNLKTLMALSNRQVKFLTQCYEVERLQSQENFNPAQCAYYSNTKVVHDLLLWQGDKAGAEKIKNWQKPQCPIKSEDFIAKGLSGEALGKALQKAEKDWVKSITFGIK